LIEIELIYTCYFYIHLFY